MTAGWRTRRAQRRAATHLLTGEKSWERFEATVIVARDHAALTDGEAEIVEDCRAAGRSVEFIASSDEGLVRIYRIGDPR